jgi:hypothetical protein
MKNGLTGLMGQAVILKVSTGEASVPLRGVLVSESPEAVRFRIGDGWDVDIFKSMILDVEEESWVNSIT